MNKPLPRIEIEECNVFPEFQFKTNGVFRLGDMHIRIEGAKKYVEILQSKGDLVLQVHQYEGKDQCERSHVSSVLLGVYSRKVDNKRHADWAMRGIRPAKPEVDKEIADQDAF